MDAFGMIEASALRRAAFFDRIASDAAASGRDGDALAYRTLAADARRTADRAKGATK
jgi:hypothetical protein